MVTISMYGDRALLVSFEQRIDEEINNRVIFLNDAIENQNLKGYKYSIPAYCSLTLAYDPFQTSFEELKREIEAILATIPSEINSLKTRELRIPVCYDENYALDFDEVREQTSLSKEKIIEQHTSLHFRVFMLGFMPGFTYMGKLPQALYCKRKEVPRLRVPRGSVGLAGYQTGIYPSELPGGWQIIGRTPLALFNPKLEDPFLFQAGDRVSFYKISAEEYEVLLEQVEKGIWNKQQILE